MTLKDIFDIIKKDLNLKHINYDFSSNFAENIPAVFLDKSESKKIGLKDRNIILNSNIFKKKEIDIYFASILAHEVRHYYQDIIINDENNKSEFALKLRENKKNYIRYHDNEYEYLNQLLELDAYAYQQYFIYKYISKNFLINFKPDYRKKIDEYIKNNIVNKS